MSPTYQAKEILKMAKDPDYDLEYNSFMMLNDLVQEENHLYSEEDRQVLVEAFGLFYLRALKLYYKKITSN